MSKNTIKSCKNKVFQYCSIADIELIIAHILKKDRVFVITNPNTSITQEELLLIIQLCKQRAKGYPLSYVTNSKEFYGRNFYIDENVLVPRPETELIIEKVLNHINKNKLQNVLIVDIGAGSGIIPITLIKELNTQDDIAFSVLASDISPKALSIAKLNAKSHSANISFYKSDLLENNNLMNMIKRSEYKEVIITSNLPYVDIALHDTIIKNKESISLQFEPEAALWSADNGLQHYKKLIEQTIKLQGDLNKNIVSFYEIDPNQAPLLTDFLKNKTKKNKLKFHKDLADKSRLLEWDSSP